VGGVRQSELLIDRQIAAGMGAGEAALWVMTNSVA